MSIRAGKQPTAADLVDLTQLKTAYYGLRPDPQNPAQQVSFGTSGHRGSALNSSFNEAHITAVCIAIIEYRVDHNITGPIFIGADTHALSEWALATTKQTLLQCGADVRASLADDYVPTPALSHAILKYNRAITESHASADGIILTPSHNPPADGGIKYNPPHAGPADSEATSWIQARANQLLQEIVAAENPQEFTAAYAKHNRLQPGKLESHDYLNEYVTDLATVIDMRLLAKSQIEFAAHPLGGAAVKYWEKIRSQYGLNLTVLGDGVDKQWAFMSLDWDGKIRMDPSSEPALQAAITAGKNFKLLVANDADADRHGIVCDGKLLNPNHYLAVAIDYLLTFRTEFNGAKSIGKTIVSSSIIDRVVAAHGAKLVEVPVGFKWFVPFFASGQMVFAGEESAGASLLKFSGETFSTDKDGITLALLAAEIYAKTGQTPAEKYRELTEKYGKTWYQRIDIACTPAQKQCLAQLKADTLKITEFAGEKLESVLTNAPGNGAAIGGLVLKTAGGWAAIRPSGTEYLLKIYAESNRSENHLEAIITAAKQLLTDMTGNNAQL